MTDEGLFLKLSVNWPDHPKLIRAGMDGRGLHATAMCIAKRLETDGWVDRMLLIRDGATDELIDSLVALALLDEDPDHPGEVRPHGWHRRNLSQAAIAASRASKSEAGRLGNHVKYKHAGSLDDCPICNKAAKITQVVAGCEGGAIAPDRKRSPESESESESETEENTPSPSSQTPTLALVQQSAPSALELDDEPASRYPADFAAWWELYPRKVGKRLAAKAYRNARKNATASRLADALEAHLPSLAAKDPQFIPHPATWLNEGRYDDPIPAPAAALDPFGPNEVYL